MAARLRPSGFESLDMPRCSVIAPFGINIGYPAVSCKRRDLLKFSTKPIINKKARQNLCRQESTMSTPPDGEIGV